MAGDIVKVSPEQLGSTSQTANTHSATVSTLSQDLGSAFTDLTNTLATVSVLNAVTSTLETFGTGLVARLACFAMGMTVINGALKLAAEAFSYLDTSLATTFLNLENQLSYYTGYETSINMPAVNVSASLAAGNYTLSTTTLTLNAASASHSSFLGSIGNAFSSAWHSTSNFVSHHGTEIAKDAAVGVAIGGLWVAGTVLAPETGGTSEVGAAAGTSALLGALG
ncbi:MAG TPA: hypothetical protein VL485_25810 [Ktedonobacteraceae bacterium]|jgi:hypothetical protein|nr:hypothetical protein [Ktedonobacteraceae bacterium]